MSGSPGLFVSIHALILGNLLKDHQRQISAETGDAPFVLLPNIILFTQVHQVSDWLGGKKLQTVHNIYLNMTCQQIAGHRRKVADKSQKLM